MNSNELEQVVKYQKQSLNYLYKWLAEEVEREKKPECLQTEEESEAINAELEFDNEQDKKVEEDLIHEEETL